MVEAFHVKHEQSLRLRQRAVEWCNFSSFGSCFSQIAADRSFTTAAWPVIAVKCREVVHLVIICAFTVMPPPAANRISTTDA